MSTSKYVTILLSGINTSSNDFTIYADSNLTTPVKSGVTRTELTNSLTPYVVLVPSATTKMVIYDNTKKCLITLDIDENNLCQSCDINFKSYSASTIGRITADVLTASCINNISDYRIIWYGPNSSTNIIWTTGYGTSFPYNSQHPLSGSTALYVPAGTYYPIIDKIKISGVTFTQTGDTTMGNIPIPAELNCLPSVNVVVSAFTCDNGFTSDLPQYQHKVNFQSVGNGQLPSNMYGTFKLSATTKAFAFSFQGFDVPDEFRIKYYGQNYGFNPILLEWWQVGTGINDNFTQLPYKWRSSDNNYDRPLKKIINFKNFNLTDNDYLTIEVIPNPTNNNTSWLTYFGCVDWNEPTDCPSCNTEYKIIKSGITPHSGNNPCQPYYGFFVPVSSCTRSELYPSLNRINDYFYNVGINVVPNNFTDNFVVFSTIWMSSQSYCDLTSSEESPWNKSICNPTPTNKKIIISKTPINPTSINVKIECEDIIDFNYYYNSYLTTKNSYLFNTPQTNPLIYVGETYYKSYVLNIPKLPTSDTECGDATTTETLYLHRNSVFTTGYSNNIYFINISASTVPDIIRNTTSFTSQCTTILCNFFFDRYLLKNNSTITGTSFTYIYNKGQKFNKPFENKMLRFDLRSVPSQGGGFDEGLFLKIEDVLNYTFAFSGSNNTLIPSLTALTCSNLTKTNYKYYYVLANGTTTSDYTIYARPIINGLPTTPEIPVLIYSGGTFTYVDSNYVI